MNINQFKNRLKIIFKKTKPKNLLKIASVFYKDFTMLFRGFLVSFLLSCQVQYLCQFLDL